MFYEVFIPAKPNDDGFDTTITVEADNWMSALKSGLERTGQGSDIRNVMCDIKDDNSIHVTDATTRRVFVLKEVDDSVTDDAAQTEKIDITKLSSPKKDEKTTQPLSPTPETPPNAFSGNKPSTQPQFRPETPAEKPSVSPLETKPTSHKKETPPNTFNADVPKTQPQFREQMPQESPPPAAKEPPKSQPPPQAAKQAPAQSKPPEQAKQPPPQKPPTQNEFAKRESSQQFAAGGLAETSWTSADGRISIGSATYEALQREEPSAKVVRETRSPSGTRPAVDVSRLEEESSVSQNILEEVFLETQRIHEGMEMEDVIAFSMDLSLEKISAEAGSIMFADLTGTEMYFATARGPKAKQVMDFRIPMGVGLVGFCVREGVSLAISDAEKDPRFYKEISEALGYETKNLCCAPIQHEGRVYGAIELLNKSRAFLPNEVSALTYIASQLAKYIHDLIMDKEKL